MFQQILTFAHPAGSNWVLWPGTKQPLPLHWNSAVHASHFVLTNEDPVPGNEIAGIPNGKYLCFQGDEVPTDLNSPYVNVLNSRASIQKLSDIYLLQMMQSFRHSRISMVSSENMPHDKSTRKYVSAALNDAKFCCGAGPMVGKW